MKRILQNLILGSCLALTMGCSAAGKPDSFTFTARFTAELRVCRDGDLRARTRPNLHFGQT